MRTATAIVLSACAFVAGCTTDDYMRIEGMTPGAGNAQAANTVLQMVDPWQPGIDNTNLKVPADRSASAAAGADGGPPEAGAAGTTYN